MASPLRCAVIGLGMGLHHANAYLEIPEAKLVAAIRAQAPGSFIYVWGSHGSGKSHLVDAAMRRPGARRLDPDSAIERFRHDPSIAAWGVDDVQGLSPTRQEALFHLYNLAREGAVASVLCAGSAAPMALALREDLRTRLGWGLVFQVHALSDDDKAAALTAMAGQRGLKLAPDVVPFMLSHFHRDMPRLTALIDALDRYSLERKRAVTLPLLRDLLSQSLLSTPDPSARPGPPTE